MKISENVAPISISLAAVALVGIILVLISWAAPVLTPIMLAWYLTALAMLGYFWLQKRGIKQDIALLLLIAALLIGGAALGLLFVISINSLQDGLALYLNNLDEFAAGIAGTSGTSSTIAGFLGSEGLGKVLVKFLPALIDAATSFLYSLVLAAFFLLEAPRFREL